MRQLKDEFARNPFQPITMTPFEEKVPEEEQVAVTNAWMHNKQIEMAHKYCINRTKVNLSKASFADQEIGALHACLNKYQLANKLYSQEANIFAKRI